MVSRTGHSPGGDSATSAVMTFYVYPDVERELAAVDNAEYMVRLS